MNDCPAGNSVRACGGTDDASNAEPACRRRSTDRTASSRSTGATATRGTWWGPGTITMSPPPCSSRTTEACARREHRHHGAMGRVLQQQCRGDGAAVAKRARNRRSREDALPRRMPCRSGNDSRTTSMPVGLDTSSHFVCRPTLIGVPQIVTRDETHARRASSPSRYHGAPVRRRASTERQ